LHLGALVEFEAWPHSSPQSDLLGFLNVRQRDTPLFSAARWSHVAGVTSSNLRTFSRFQRFPRSSP